VSGYEGIKHKYDLSKRFDENETSKGDETSSRSDNPELAKKESINSSVSSKTKKSSKYSSVQSSDKTKSFLSELKKKGKKDLGTSTEVEILVNDQSLATRDETKASEELPISSDSVSLDSKRNDVISSTEQEKDSVQDGTEACNDRSEAVEPKGPSNPRKRSRSLTEEFSSREKEGQNEHLGGPTPTGASEDHRGESRDEAAPDQSTSGPTGFIPPPPPIDLVYYTQSIPDPERKTVKQPKPSMALLNKISNNQRAGDQTMDSGAQTSTPVGNVAAQKRKRPAKIEERMKEVMQTNSRESMEQYFRDGPLVYELMGILIHRGGAYGGHYYAYIKNFEDKDWYLFDDTMVHKTSLETVADDAFGGMFTNASGYMLFYQLMESDPRPANYLEIPRELKDTCSKELEKEKEESRPILCSNEELQQRDWPLDSQRHLQAQGLPQNGHEGRRDQRENEAERLSENPEERIQAGGAR
jgi:hypothetical protein